MTKSSSLGYSKTDTTTYFDNLSKWVLGQTATASTNGIQVSRTDYDATTALPIRSYTFGKLQQTLAYNVDGTLATITDGNNHVTTLSNWYRGIPRSIKHADATTRSAVVDDNGWIRSVTDENGYVTGYGYDAMGRLASIAYPTGDSTVWNTTTLSFTPVATAEYGIPAGHWKQTVSTGNARKVTYFDGMWRPLVQDSYDAANVANTRSISVKRYDLAGRPAFQSYALGALTDYAAVTQGARTTYDALDRVIRTEQDSELGVLASTTAYLSGFQTQVTNPRGFQTTISYLAYDQPSTDWPVAITHPEGAYTDIVRDVFGKPTAVTRRDAAGSAGNTVTRGYAYNTYQELCKTTEPETGATLMGYDLAGNQAWSAAGLPGATACDPTGTTAAVVARKVARSYDARNRLSALTFAGGNGSQSWRYTPDGLPQSVTTANDAGASTVSNTYAYNRRRLLTSESQALSDGIATWSIGYGYTANGHMASLVYPAGLTVDYAPNALGQPTKAASATSAFASAVSYYPNGAIKQFSYGNGIVHTLVQNARQLPDRSRDAYGTTAVLDDSYDFDATGNVAAISDGLTGARGNRTMGYDGLDRLKDTTSPMYGTAGAHYTYDVLDNLKTVIAPGRNQSYVYDASQRLTNVMSGGVSVIGLGYDVQGNLANKNGVIYSFDLGNRMRQGGTDQYRYDAYGRRVRASSGAGRIYTMYSQAGQPLWVRDERAGQRRQYVYLGGSLVAERRRPIGTDVETLRYQHTDALGSPVAVTDASRTVIERSEYEPYGKLLNRPLTDGPGYAGHVSDAATGLSYMQQRYYDPGIGRFLSVDPVTANSGTGANFNRYWYANNNPYRFIDPDGRVSDDPDRQHRGVGPRPSSPATDKVNYEKGGAPTGKIAAQMKSESSSDRTAAAKTAMAIADVKGNPNDLAYNKDLSGVASATTDPSGAVEVGPDAFVTWSWLTSTLGHEFEVHVTDFATLGPIKNDRDNDMREVKAHQYNLDNASRFRNNPGEIQRHQELRDAYKYRAEGER